MDGGCLGAVDFSADAVGCVGHGTGELGVVLACELQYAAGADVEGAA